MIYNSNGNNAPYNGSSNVQLNKKIKALEESVRQLDESFNIYVGTDWDPLIYHDNTGKVEDLQADVTNVESEVVEVKRDVTTLDGKVTALDTSVTTGTVTAQNADFQKVVAGKYVFQNGYQTFGSTICKLEPGSVVWATDGNNAVLVDYTDKDAWVAKAKTTGSNKFKIYTNGVLQFTEANSWNVYVVGNDFVTDDRVVVSYNPVTYEDVVVGVDEDTGTPIYGQPAEKLQLPQTISSYQVTVVDPETEEETTVTKYRLDTEVPVEMETGITIGGTLYAALARNYTFDTVTTETIHVTDEATVNTLTATSTGTNSLQVTGSASIAHETVEDGTVVNLTNSKRNIQDARISISAHQTNKVTYIKIPKFTGTYNLKLRKVVNGLETDLFTATIIWNGKDPIVQYKEYSDAEPVDYLYSIILTERSLYFVTQGDGTLYYSYDVFGELSDPVATENFPWAGTIPDFVEEEGVRADYTTEYHNRTVFFGDHSVTSGVDVLGELNADWIKLPEGFSIENLEIEGTLKVDGATTLADVTANTVEADKLLGTSLEVSETETVVDPDTQGETTVTHKYVEADNTGLTVNVDTELNGDLNQTGDATFNGVVVIGELE